MSSVRVRFAPSPTGFFHIGSARTALFNWLYARHTGGTFVLRIEDTDKERNSEAFLNVIYDSLTWLGLNWDEGPRVGGSFGPYRQSERTDIYKVYLKKLLDGGRAYEKDGAIWFKLDGERYEVFDEHRKKTVTKVRRAPTVIEDRIRGHVERLEDEDFVIFRSDGNPVFHFVNVVDDISMAITHVIRGEDHLSNASKHVELFKAFGASVPEFAHIPLILKQNGPGKMSKRDQGALISEYEEQSFLPDAVVNYLALLGWNPGDDREKMSRDEIVQLFDLSGVNQSNARFDEKKMKHLNMLYLADNEADEFVSRARAHFEKQIKLLSNLDPKTEESESNLAHYRAALSDPDYFREVMLLARPKVTEIAALAMYTRYFFIPDDELPLLNEVVSKVMAKGKPLARLHEFRDAAEKFDLSSDKAIEDGIKELANRNGLSFSDYQPIARLALSGTNIGPSVTGMMRVLGRGRVFTRLSRCDRLLREAGYN